MPALEIAGARVYQGVIMASAPQQPGQPLESFRPFLKVTAIELVDRSRRRDIDPSDLVQQTLVKALELNSKFQGTTDAERAAWMRSILRTVMIDSLRKHPKRRVASQSPGSNTLPLLDLHPAENQLTPSKQLMKLERLAGLAEALLQLPPDQRQAMQLRYLDGLSVSGVATQMNRTPESVFGLLFRATKKLRSILSDS